MIKEMTTPSEENYLEWIYRFSQSGPVRPSDIADKLGVKRPSVSRAISSLVRKGMLKDGPRGRLELTLKGEEIGKAVVRRDKCLTALLVDVLGMPAEAADAEVHRLEHVLGDDVLRRMEILISFAKSSPAWLKRLRLRIDQAPPAAGDEEEGYRVGLTPIHSGLQQEKSTCGRPATD